jgi:hypothetical protein
VRLKAVLGGRQPLSFFSFLTFSIFRLQVCEQNNTPINITATPSGYSTSSPPFLPYFRSV